MGGSGAGHLNPRYVVKLPTPGREIPGDLEVDFKDSQILSGVWGLESTVGSSVKRGL